MPDSQQGSFSYNMDVGIVSILKQSDPAFVAVCYTSVEDDHENASAFILPAKLFADAARQYLSSIE